MKEAAIAITFNCNSRCQHCNIWQRTEKEELPLNLYKKLPPSLKEICISGGEPFLKKDIEYIIKIIRRKCNKARIMIVTNGLMPDVIEEKIKKLLLIDKNLGVRISIDGLKNEHEKIRGISGAYKKALNSLIILKKSGIKNLGISFTIYKQNIKDLYKIFLLSKKFKIDFTFSIAHSSDIFYGKIKPKINIRDFEYELRKIIKIYLKSKNIKNWFRAYFVHGLISFVLKKKNMVKCVAGKDYIYISPNGNIYPCHILNITLGNLKENNLNNIKNNGLKFYKKIAKNCNKCWLMCSARPSIKNNKMKALCWIFLNKIKYSLI